MSSSNSQADPQTLLLVADGDSTRKDEKQAPKIRGASLTEELFEMDEQGATSVPKNKKASIAVQSVQMENVATNETFILEQFPEFTPAYIVEVLNWIRRQQSMQQQNPWGLESFGSSGIGAGNSEPFPFPTDFLNKSNKQPSISIGATNEDQAGPSPYADPTKRVMKNEEFVDSDTSKINPTAPKKPKISASANMKHENSIEPVAKGQVEPMKTAPSTTNQAASTTKIATAKPPKSEPTVDQTPRVSGISKLPADMTLSQRMSVYSTGTPPPRQTRSAAQKKKEPEVKVSPPKRELRKSTEAKPSINIPHASANSAPTLRKRTAPMSTSATLPKRGSIATPTYQVEESRLHIEMLDQTPTSNRRKNRIPRRFSP